MLLLLRIFKVALLFICQGSNRYFVPLENITSLLTYARLDQFDAVVTDSSVTREYRELLAEKQVRLIVAHE